VDVDSFIAKHSAAWGRLEEASRDGASGLARRSGAEISETVTLYLEVSSHLTEVRSRYADPDLERYLNDLVARARQAIYAVRPGTVVGFFRFFGARYREQIRRTTPFIVVAVVIVMSVTLASWFWIANSHEARLGLIPPAARAAIRRFDGTRDPSLGPSDAIATVILSNNVSVAFFAFALGITLGLGTVYILVQNAVMLGVLAGAFGAAGHGAAFWSLILPHGLLELTAICIAAGAGLRMGWAIVEPGDRSRAAALSEEATGAVVVVLGVIPAFVIAAAIEGFVTGSSVPAGVQIGLGIAIAVSYVAFLFGWRPGGRRGRRADPSVTGAPPT